MKGGIGKIDQEFRIVSIVDAFAEIVVGMCGCAVDTLLFETIVSC